MTPTEAATAIDKPINRLGSKFMFDPSTYAGAAEYGYAGFDFYFAGRCGVLGNVDASVVAAAMGFFEPNTVRAMWEQGCAAQPPARGAALFAESLAQWGRDHYGAELDYGELSSLAARVIDAAAPAALPLFAGWRELPVPPDAKGAAAHRLNVLREFRGGVHLVAVVAAGIAPADAVLLSGGPPNAALFGYAEPYPDVSALTPAMDEAQAHTDRLGAAPLLALDADERARFCELVTATRAGLA